MEALFASYTIRTVLLGAAIFGAVSGVMGSYALLRRQSLMGDAMSHAALPGIVLIFMLTGLRSPAVLLAGAFVASWLGALLVSVTTQETRLKQDSALGIVLAVFFGFGMVLLSWVQRNIRGPQAGLDQYLFGQAAALVQRDVVVMGVVGGVVLLLVVLFWKELKLFTFDPDFAATIGLPVRLLDILLTTLIVTGIVVGLQMVGVVLMAAMLVAPAAAARQWTDRFDVMVILSAVFGALAGMAGALISSTARGLSTGPVIVLTASAVTLISLLLAPNRGLIWDWIRRRRANRKLGAERVLEAMAIMASNHNKLTYPHSTEAIQAALPRYNVPDSLRDLKSRGFVTEVAGDSWALTQKGITQVNKLQEETHATDRVMVGAD
ncbi:MAG: metal ABC transporter permease [Chloroflexi bacterium]|nr:metal ABC transporter permease [Chloroflexota bacterium]